MDVVISTNLPDGPSPRTRGKRRRSRGSARPPAVHPRARGENHINGRVYGDLFGPSPRTRGKRRAPMMFSAASVGPSPRTRGKRAFLRSGAQTATVHPRARGENRDRAGDVRRDRRSIPAHAGKTTSSRALKWKKAGPSPRTRGKRVLPPGRSRGPTVHPRARGENQLVRHRHQRHQRSIPAHAGKTLRVVNNLGSSQRLKYPIRRRLRRPGENAERPPTMRHRGPQERRCPPGRPRRATPGRASAS